jgi:hypothetical protein
MEIVQESLLEKEEQDLLPLDEERITRALSSGAQLYGLYEQ